MHVGDRERSVPVWSSEGAMALTEKMQIMPQDQLTTHRPIQEPREHAFSPYEFNGGTTIAITGSDFAVLAADTRLSSGYSILSRDVSKARVFHDHCAMASGGCRTDVLTLQRTLQTRFAQYKLRNQGDDIPVEATAQLLSTTLYYRRFFPYYAFNILAGIDKEGKGACFTYDAIGSFERTEYAAQGSGQKLMIPVLDNVIGFKNREQEKPELTVDEAVEIVKDSFITAGERNIYVGDAVEIFIMQAGKKMVKTRFELKKD